MTDPTNDSTTDPATGSSRGQDDVVTETGPDTASAEQSTDTGDAVEDLQTGPAAVDDDAADETVMTMLHEHVPLSLILDLTTPEGPDSASILAEEGQPEDAWWVQS